MPEIIARKAIPDAIVDHWLLHSDRPIETLLMRVVSLTCSNTEIVSMIGCATMLVGIDDYSDYPPDVVKSLPRVGRDLDIDVQRVIELKPDLVLASLTVPGHEKIVDQLDSAGLPYIALEPLRLADVYRDILQIGELLGAVDGANRCVSEMKQTLKSAEQHLEKPSVLIQWWPKPVIAPGQLSWTEDLIEAAGLINPIGGRSVKSTPLTDEEVRDLDPDAIVISWCGVHHNKYRPKVVYRNPVWRDTGFVIRKRVFTIPEAFLGRPSPRLIDGYLALRDIANTLNSTKPSQSINEPNSEL